MKIHWLQHVVFEGLGSIEKWAQEKGHALSCTRLFAGETLPALEAFEVVKQITRGPTWEYPTLARVRAELNRGKQT